MAVDWAMKENHVPGEGLVGLMDSFSLRSFDFCSEEASCNLYDQHSLDVPDDMLNTSYSDCAHYSRA